MLRTFRRFSSGIDPNQKDAFAQVKDWWNPTGSMGILHEYNKFRVGWMERKLSLMGPNPLDGKTLLDIGCGGGLLCESMAKLGAKVTGIDATTASIEAATAHKPDNLDITYLEGDLSVLNPGKFDIVTCFEVIEHADDQDELVSSASECSLEHLFMSTIAKTPQSYLVAIVGAEYITRVVPVGTHTWEKFINFEDLQEKIEWNGLIVKDAKDVVYNPLKGDFHEFDFWKHVNYILHAKRESLE